VPRFLTGVVREVLSERPGLQRLAVDVDGRPRRAYVLTGLIGPAAAGDRVVLNTVAVDLGLGTGGWDVVHWNLSRSAWEVPGGGHVLKLRYTSLQVDVGAAEEQAGYAPGSVAGLPVVVCALHSQLGPVASVFKALAPDRRLVYVMTDTAALPLDLSDLVAALRRAHLVDATVTAGQAFGGDYEAVNVPSALEVAAGPARADAVVVGMGPGGVGTSTRLGFSGLEVASTLDAAARAGAHPVVALRWSGADGRSRHRGISRHSTVALEGCDAPALVGVPKGLEVDVPGAHRVVEVEVPDVAALLAAAGLDVRTMGRGPSDDPEFFAVAGAAGVVAAGLCQPAGPGPVDSSTGPG
jgi:uncharacterized protein DUF3866